MKTLTLEINEQAYPQIIQFLRLLSEEQCRIIEDEEDTLTADEISRIHAIRAKQMTSKDSGFDDWADIRDTL